MNERIVFFGNQFKNGRKNASITPSSKFLAKQMVKNIDFSTIDSVIELGAGTGIFTEYILKNTKPGTKVICIETEENYVQILKEKFGNKIIIHQEDVKNIDQIRKTNHIEKIDLIVSWLPFIPAESIHKEIKKYTSEWTIFRSFTYQPSIFKKQYHDFPIKKIWYTFFNIPPARVFGVN